MKSDMRGDPRDEPAPSQSAGRDASPAVPGLYVHVPFCKTKCPYCDFYSIVSGVTPGEWLTALSVEAERARGAFAPFDTIYIGGGTPSLLSAAEVESLFASVRGAFVVAPGAEVTLEANPDDVTPGKLAAWRELGVNRLSLGIQSFDDAELAFLRRRHDARAARAAIELAREAGFGNVGIDLIYGFEGQSLASWGRTLATALEAAPEHLSCYQLSIEPRTEFGRMRERGEFRAMDEESQRRFFIRTSETLRSAGYVHYEISNYAREDALASRHNSKYWRHAPYLGLGPSAHSFKGGRRWWNVRSVRGYCDALADGGSAVEGEETLTAEQLDLEALYLGFRTRGGVPLEALRAFPNWRTALDSLVLESLVAVRGDRVVPTIEGFLVADRLPLAFVEWHE